MSKTADEILDGVAHKSEDGPRSLTNEEIRDIVLDQMWALVDYWAAEAREIDKREKLAGLAFSILAMLDGSSIAIPAFRICTAPHSDDQEYHKKRGENWFPNNSDVEMEGEITELPLHEFWHRRDPRVKK